MRYSEDERKVIGAIASCIRRDEYSQMDSDYMFDMEWSAILPDPVDQYERLSAALNSLRKRNFDSYSRDTTTLDGYIMKARLNKAAGTVQLLISADIVLQLISNYQDDLRADKAPAMTLEELKELVRMG